MGQIQKRHSGLKVIQGGKAKEGKKVDGLKSAADLINALSPTERAKLIKNLTKANPGLTQKIEEKMFVFEDLVKIDSKGLQLLLRGFPQTRLLAALRSASTPLKEAVFKTLSPRLAKLIQEELQIRGPDDLSDVARAQQELVKIAKQMIAEGKIALEDQKRFAK